VGETSEKRATSQECPRESRQQQQWQQTQARPPSRKMDLLRKGDAPRLVSAFGAWIDYFAVLLALIVFPFEKSPRFSKKRLQKWYTTCKGMTTGLALINVLPPHSNMRLSRPRGKLRRPEWDRSTLQHLGCRARRCTHIHLEVYALTGGLTKTHSGGYACYFLALESFSHGLLHRGRVYEV